MNSFAIIDDADEFAPSGFDVDLNAGGQRVEAVFEQLLDDVGGAFDDLAGGDLVDD